MPFVRISLKTGQSSEYIKNISESVHESLVNIFGISELDKFQVISEVEASNIIFPESYFNIPHSDNIVYIHITAKKGRTVAMKQALYQMIADLINQRTGLSRDDIIIIIAENEEENWSFGRGKAQLVQ